MRKQQLLAGLLAMAATGQFMTSAPAQQTVAGKIVAISHQKIQVNNNWQDQVSVMVDSCATPGQITEVHYSPSRLSDRTALGHLFEETLQSARSALMDKPQPQRQINGYGLFWVDANNKVTRTGILGHDVDCRVVPSLVEQFK